MNVVPFSAAARRSFTAALAAPPLEDASEALAIWKDHFHLLADPFALTPDPEFLYLSDGHAEALAGLKLGLLESRGLIVMIGEVGTGKTTIVYSLLGGLDPQVETAYVSNPTLTFDELLQHALEDFGVRVTGSRRLDLLDALNGFLRRCGEAGKTVALVIDEAQNLSDESFEQLRLLLNFETYKKKLLQIVLAGQPELAARLRHPRLRQIADRIAVRCHLTPLSSQEARSYVEQRLKTAGGTTRLFTRAALSLLLKASRGIPRRINTLCHNALLFAYGRGLYRVDRTLAAQAIREKAGEDPMSSWRPWRGPRKPAFRITRRGAAALITLALAGVAAWPLAVSSIGLFSSPAPPEAPAAAAPERVADPPPPVRLAEAAAPPGETAVPAPQPAAEPEASKAVAPVAGWRTSGQTTARLTLRSGPGIEHSVITTLAPGTRLEILDRDRGWLRITDDEREGWVTSDYVQLDAERSRGPSSAGERPEPVRVAAGDTLSSLVQAQYGSYHQAYVRWVQEANPELTDPNDIKRGQTLVFPLPAGPAGFGTDGRRHE